VLRLAAVALLVSGVSGLQPSLAVRDVDRGDHSNIDERREVAVRTTAEWTTLWQQHTPDRRRPAVDFPREMVVGVFLGSRPTAGFSAEVASVSIVEGALVVRYREKRPTGGGVTAQVITSPFHLVVVPARPGTVRFERIP